MSKRETTGINTIQSGRIDYYFPLIFETKYKYSTLCEMIQSGIDNNIDKHIAKIQNT